MNNIMVCVTKEETVDTLIEYIYRNWGNEDNKIYFVHVGSYEMYYMNKTEEEIAQIMSITPRAVDNYMTRILSKLGVVTKKELLQKFGFQQGR